MATFVLAFVLIALAMLGLGLGVLRSGRPIRGSCGGLVGACGWCGGGHCRDAGAESDQGDNT